MTAPAIQNVSDTAFMVAQWRALESARPDALFRDPLAAKLAGEEGRRIAADVGQHSMMGGWSLVIRTVVIDDLIAAAVKAGVDTVLNLGAGLDSRPYRMELPTSLRWIEADLAPIIELKEARLAGDTPRCALERAKVDLSDAAARRAFLGRVAQSAKRVLVLTEGVIPYLPMEDVAALADDMHALPLYGWIADYFSPQVLRYRQRIEKRALSQAPFKFAPDDYFGFFASHRFRPREERYLAEEGARLGRPFKLPGLMGFVMPLLRRLAPPEKRNQFGKFTGYVLFEPV